MSSKFYGETRVPLQEPRGGNIYVAPGFGDAFGAAYDGATARKVAIYDAGAVPISKSRFEGPLPVTSNLQSLQQCKVNKKLTIVICNTGRHKIHYIWYI